MRRRDFVRAGLTLTAAGFAAPDALAARPRRPVIRAHRHHPPPDGIVKLSSNENPLGLCPAARQAVIDGIEEANRYPGALRRALIEALATKHAVKPENIVLGAGSTEVLQMLVQATAAPNAMILLAEPTYEDVPGYAEHFGYWLAPTPLTAAFAHDIERMRDRARTAVGPVLVFLCNPNNPTGTLTSSDTIDEWLSEAPAHVRFIVDEAYFEFANDPGYHTSVDWIWRNPNVVVTRTFSKIYGMAGMRLGYGIAHEATAAQLREYASRNNANHLALVAALTSLRDEELVERGLATNARGRAILYDVLGELELAYLPSHTNFVMHRINGDLRSYRERMREAGILVGRPFPPMLDHNRISIGLPEEMSRFAETLRGFRKKGWV